MPEIPASHRDLLDGQFATLATLGPMVGHSFPRSGSSPTVTRSASR